MTTVCPELRRDVDLRYAAGLSGYLAATLLAFTRPTVAPPSSSVRLRPLPGGFPAAAETTAPGEQLDEALDGGVSRSPLDNFPHL